MQSPDDTLYLSVVVTGPVEGTQAFVERWERQAKRLGLRSEVIAAGARDSAARNAAVRRARGEFILVTQSSVIFSDQVMQFLANRSLEEHRLYRIDTSIAAGEIGHVTHVCAREGTFALTAEGFRRNEPRDIAAVDSGVYFGAGCFFPQAVAGSTFRWIENDAEIFLRMPAGGRVLGLEFEPGSEIDAPPAVLRVLDGAGTIVAEWQVTGRMRTELAVPPPRSGDLQRLRLKVVAGGQPVSDDGPVRNLRFLRCDWVDRDTAAAAPRSFADLARENWPTLARLLTSMRASAGSLAVLRRGPGAFHAAVRMLGSRGRDVFTAGEEFRFGQGWHRLETAGGERFRWAAQHAEMLLRITRRNYELGLLVEPGPSLSSRAFTLTVRDAAGAQLARQTVDGLTWIRFAVPFPEDAVVKLIFMVEGEGTPAAGDPRILNFRVLACGGESGNTVTPDFDIHACWPNLLIDEQPADIESRPAAGMSMPAFVHTNASADFTLMSRDDWSELRGYPELEAPPERVETLLCYTAHFAGARQQILREPMRIYRLEDETVPLWSGTSCLSAEELQQLVLQMRTLRAPVIYNAWEPVAPRAADNPYLSVVIAARNDNHGGNMLGRTNAFFTAWLEQAQRYGVSSEIIVVEWNPPCEKPRLMDAIDWPAGPQTCHVRFVEVSPEIHRQFPHAGAVPLHQMIAKNVGIRRARGEFVLATNLDIVFSAELMQFLAARRLEAGHMYRMDRYDVSSEIPAGAGVDELLAFCRDHRLRVFTGEGGFALGACGLRELEQADIVAPAGGIRFGKGWYAVETYDDERFRWIAEEAEIIFTRPARGRLRIDADNGPSTCGAGIGIEVVSAEGAVLGSGTVKGRTHLLIDVSEPIASGFRLRVLGGGVPLTHDLRMLNVRIFGLDWEPAAGNARLEVVRVGPGKEWSSFVQSASPYAACMRDPAYLHTNACGDFTMLARDDWFRLRGYPEFPIWPMHIDALLCYEAHHAGVRQVILSDPMRMFHIEHLTGAGWTPEGEEERRARIARKGVPAMEYDEVEQWVHRMRRFNAPIIVTRSDWGLGRTTLPERTLGG